MPQESQSTRARAVVITGSSTGIGAACAVDLVRHGFRVFAGVRSPADAQRLRELGSPALLPIMLDVTDAAQVRAAAELVGAGSARSGWPGWSTTRGSSSPGRWSWCRWTNCGGSSR